MKFENEENLSFFPQCVLDNIMMTSLLADKSVLVKVKITMSFMNEIINPPCNSLLATFFESICGVYPKTVSSSLRRLIRPKRTISQLFNLLFPLPLLLSPKKMLLEREARRVLWEVQRDQLKKAVCARQSRALRLMWRTTMRTLMLLVVWTRLGSLDRSLRDSRSQRSFVAIDWRRECPRVSLTPFTFRNVGFQVFINYH